MQFSTFTFTQQHNVRAFEQNGLTWFVAADVCAALELSNSRMALASLDDDEKAEAEIQTAGGKQTVRIINESGLYILILRSRKAMEKGTVQHKFRKWVTNEVLPTIRKTGSYTQKITSAQKQQIQAAVNARVRRTGQTHQAVYTIVHQLAQVASYHDIAAADFDKVMDCLHGEILDKETLPAANLNDYELTRIAQFLSNTYSMMISMHITQEPLRMLGVSFGKEARQYLTDNLPLLQAVVHGLQRFRLNDPLCAPEFDKHMQYLSRAGLPV